MTVGVHKCAHPECRTQVPIDLLACRPHWNSLPKDLRDRAWIAWQRICTAATHSALDAHRAVKAECVAWWSR